jgi:hypothetical protein
MSARRPILGDERNQGQTEQPVGLSTRWASWANLILGAILFISPWYSITWFNARSSWNAWILGVAIMLVAIWALASVTPAFVSWINVLLGIWVFISPWVLRFAVAQSVEAWSAWIIGALVFLLACYVVFRNRTPNMRATM